MTDYSHDTDEVPKQPDPEVPDLPDDPAELPPIETIPGAKTP